MRRVLFVLFSVLVLALPCSADFEDTEIVEADDDFEWLGDLPSPSDFPIGTSPAEVTEAEPVETDPLPELVQSEILPIDNTYGGAWSGAVLDYFEGCVLNNFLEHYVAFRSSQNVYQLYIGKISYKNGMFQGSDLQVITYNTNNYNTNEYVSIGVGNLNQYADGIYYSDLSGGACFVSQKICFLLFLLGVVFCVGFTARIFTSFFKRR